MSIGFGDALAVVQLGIDLWSEIKGAQEEVDLMGEELKTTLARVSNAQSLVPKDKVNLLQEVNPTLYKTIQQTISKIDKVATRVKDILAGWLKVARFLPGAKWSFEWVAAMMGLVKGKLKELRGHRVELSKLHDNLDHHMLDMTLHSTLKIMEELQKRRSALKPSPTPPPRPSKKNVIFVDSFNSGRSVVAQSYLYLVHQWTTRTNNYWPLSKWESAGNRVSSRSAFAEQTAALKPGFQLVKGDTPAFATAVNALFDQPYFNYEYKRPIRENALKRKSRGLPADLFSGNDYILVFTREQRDMLESLRERHRATLSGEAKKATSRAKIELLGSYGNLNKAEIGAPRGDDSDMEKKWQGIVRNTKTCVRAFLEQQCGWQKPAFKDGHLQGPKLQGVGPGK